MSDACNKSMEFSGLHVSWLPVRGLLNSIDKVPTCVSSAKVEDKQVLVGCLLALWKHKVNYSVT